MKLLSLIILVAVLVVCGSCTTGKLNKNTAEPLTFHKKLTSGHYIFFFDYHEGDLPGKPVVTGISSANSTLDQSGTIGVFLNGNALWSEECQFFRIRRSEKYPEWGLTRGTIPEYGNVQIVVSGEVARILNDRGLRFRRSVK